jgi:hypothetical protein
MKTRPTRKDSSGLLGAIFVLILTLTLSLLMTEGDAAIPQKINYQGYLTNAAGVPVHGTVEMQFLIYDVQAGGTPLWSEWQIVMVNRGLYNVNLGEVTPITLAFDKPYYLGVQIFPDPEMEPRKVLTSVGYAFRALTAETVTSGGGITGVIAGNGLTGGGTSGDVTLNVGAGAGISVNPGYVSIATGGVITEMLASHAVTNDKLAGNAVTQDKIADNAVGSAKIVDGTIGSQDLANGAVTPAKISSTGATSGQVLKFNGTSVAWANDEGGDLTLPYSGTINSSSTAFDIHNAGTGVGIKGSSTNGYGVYAYSQSNIALRAQNSFMLFIPEPSGSIGVWAYGADTGVYGSSTNGDGIVGKSDVQDKSGVYGFNSHTGGYGIFGRNTGTGNFGYLGGGYGVYGEAASDQHYAAGFKGNVRVLSRATGAVLIELGEGLDYAEGFPVSDKTKIVPGSILIIDSDQPGKLRLSDKPYDTKVAGIVAGAKGLGSAVRLGVGQFDFDVALAGRVYCNVDSTYGEVAPGDLLTTSPTPGYAMVVKDHTKAQGAILGKAMERLPPGHKAQILVLVTLQ